MPNVPIYIFTVHTKFSLHNGMQGIWNTELRIINILIITINVVNKFMYPTVIRGWELNICYILDSDRAYYQLIKYLLFK